jgi:HSP20 family protein
MNIEETIARVDHLYRTVTGREPPSSEVPYAPIPPERDAQQHVEEQLHRLMTVLGGNPEPALTTTWTPPVSAWEGKKEIVLCVELPGVPREAIEVAVTQNLLQVAGHRTAPVTTGGEVALRAMERPVGPFRRVIALPLDAQTEQMSAQSKDGVLEIRVPRKANGQAQTIPVK